MESCSNSSASALSGIPDDPLVDILSRVPAKSVCRFKCVSKAWRDLIADPDHRKKLRQAMQGLFVQSSEYSRVNNTKLPRTSFSFIDLTTRSVPLDSYPSFSFLTEMTGIQAFFVFDSCNGLVLLGHRQNPSSDSSPLYYTVCNPTTKQWSAVPACGSGEPLTYAYLAFDPDVSSHFHLVQFQLPDVYDEIVSLHVYSSEIEIWSQNQIDEQKEQGQLEGWPHQFTLDIEASNNLHAFVNGFLHVIVSRLDLQHILVLDLQGKARRMIALPGIADGRSEHASVCYFGQSQGHLHCATLDYSRNMSDYELSIWVLQDYDTHEWMLKDTVDLNSLDIFRETRGPLDFCMVDIHQDCNVVLFLQGSHKLAAYNMDCKEASIISTFKDHKDSWEFVRYVPYFSESPYLTNKH